MKKTGLTIGKFAPLHKGHQYLIETALIEVDTLYILIYNTNVVSIPLQIRANWIRALYPTAQVIEGWDGPEGYSNERSFEIVQENYIIKMLNGVTITHFYSSEFYGEHVSKCLNALDRRIDQERRHIPISATSIRFDPFINRKFLESNIYKDLIIKVVFLGAMSTGKTTLTKALAQIHKTSFVEEYGREYWEKNQVNRRITYESFDHIVQKHIENVEISTINSNKYLFIDTNAISTYMYSLDYYGMASTFVKQAAISCSQYYDLNFLCNDDIDYEDTWDRSGEQKREVFHKKIIADLNVRNIHYIILNGNLEQRINKVNHVLLQFQKYSNFFGNVASMRKSN